jgi:phenylpropionate dioxygenase-like ring-hydroxylating dioxygenase large terminal subunit
VSAHPPTAELVPKDRLAPPRVKRAWYILCQSGELRPGRVLPRRLWGRPLVLFRTRSGAAGALVDRCPHRNVPLSEGQVVEETLQCPYHGWRFDAGGRCKAIPGLSGDPDKAAHAADAHAVREQQGFVWVWGEPGEAPVGEPFRFRCADDRSYLVVRREVAAEGTVHGVAENALDVPHTAFLHGGLFRTDRDRKPITCVVTREADRVECEYVGEERPKGIVGRMLSPSGGQVVHFDRFYLPSVVEVEYRLGTENHVLVDAALTPVDDFHTKLFAVVALKTRVPWWIVRPLVTPIALRIFGQDAKILRRQSETMHAFGEQRFVSTPIDGLGPHILKLLLRAADGVPTERTAPWRKEFTLLV